VLGRMHPEDKAEAAAVQDAIQAAVAGHDSRAPGDAVRSLKELLFFVEGASCVRFSARFSAAKPHARGAERISPRDMEARS